MEVIINKYGEIVSQKRGTFYAGTVNSKIVTLAAIDDVFASIPKSRRLVHINLTREDDQQSGWLLMDSLEENIYFYKCQKWDLFVPGELKIVFKITDTATGEEITTSEAKAVIKNGVIAQPACLDNETRSELESYYNDLSRAAFRNYDVEVIDTYPIVYKGTDDYKTPRAIYINYKHLVPDTADNEDIYIGSLFVTNFVKDGIVYQTEIFYAGGKAWSRELSFSNDEYFTKLTDSEFISLGVGLQGEKGKTGKTFNPRGEWNPNSIYENGEFFIDTFYYKNSLYYTKATAEKGTTPSNEQHFGLLLESKIDVVFDDDINNIQMDGDRSIGSSDKAARSNHVHPHDSTKLDKFFGEENAGRIAIVGDDGNLTLSRVKLYENEDEFVLEVPTNEDEESEL